MIKEVETPTAREFLSAIHQLAHDKNIDSEIILEMLKDALVAAAEKYYRNEKRFMVEISEEAGEINIYALKKVTDPITDPTIEISLEDARAIREDAELDQDIRFLKDKEEMGRIAANAAKQVIVSKVKEHEKYNIYKEFEKRIGEVVNVSVRRFERGNVIVDMGKTEGIIRREQLIPKEKYSVGDRVRAVIAAIYKTGDAQVELSEPTRGSSSSFSRWKSPRSMMER
ncbi:MAG: S1 RNA-binding domain-containing protein [Anaerotruncus sp.]|nr:S1 RNA-binding domain-containing protein [Anaerotruncus sp.]